MKGEGTNTGRQLSIVVPCLDEAAGIVAALDQLQPLRRRGVEVIVVDGGSHDDSVALASSLVDRILTAPRGRASQMNAGAAGARGDVLLFLHADCMLPVDADRSIIDGLATSGRRWGRFDVRLQGANPLLGVVGFLMNWRSRLTAIATGDQAIFVSRELFAAAGGFPAIALMEDVAFSRTLKSHGAPLCLHECITASSRRWERHGVLRTILLMWRLRLAYFFGADPAALARQYGQLRSRPAIGVAVFARAPEPRLAKTRLIPLLGAERAARLQDQLTVRALATAHAAGIGPVTLWCTPSVDHPSLERAALDAGADRAPQCAGDLGTRMHAAATSTLANFAGVIIIGTDCPALTPSTLHAAASALTKHDAVLIPAEDGGYVLLGLSRTDAGIFTNVEWGSAQVMAATRRNLTALGWRWHEMTAMWDVDRPADFERLRASGLMPEIDCQAPSPNRANDGGSGAVPATALYGFTSNKQKDTGRF